MRLTGEVNLCNSLTDIKEESSIEQLHPPFRLYLESFIELTHCHNYEVVRRLCRKRDPPFILI
jgi:hypothetical protein